MVGYILTTGKSRDIGYTDEGIKEARLLAKAYVKDRSNDTSVVYIYESHRYSRTLIGLVREGDRRDTFTFAEYGGKEKYLKKDGSTGKIVRWR